MNQIIYSGDESVEIKKEITKRKRKKITRYKKTFTFLIVALFLFSSFYAYSEYDRVKKEKESEYLLETFRSIALVDDDSPPSVIISGEYDDEEQNNTQNEVKTITGPTSDDSVVCTINIPKIAIEYPVVAKTTEELLKNSLTKFLGPNPNEVGNFCISGHNYKNGKFFGKLNQVEIRRYIYDCRFNRQNGKL